MSPIVSPALSVLGLTIARAADGAGVGVAFGAAAEDTAPAAAAPASRRTLRRVFIAGSEDPSDRHRDEREMAPEDEVGIRLDLHVPALDEEGSGGPRPEGDPDTGVPPELVLRVLDLARLARRGELDP